MFTLGSIQERAARGEAPGGGPGCRILRPGVWKPQFRTEFPPEAAYMGDQVGQFGLALRAMWNRAWEENGENWQG
eukprot:8621615-Alexandrium_andersonii.AAC.2